MNDNFTKNAKSVLSNGTSEAERLGSGTIDTGHLVLGMLRIKSCIATQIISSYIEDLSLLKDRIENIIKDNSPIRTNAHTPHTTPLSTTATRVLQLAFLESISKHLPRVGTRHILAAILRLEQGNTVRDLFVSYGLTLDKVRNFDTSNEDSNAQEQNIPPNAQVSGVIYMQGAAAENILNQFGLSPFGADAVQDESGKQSQKKSHKQTKDDNSTRYLDNFGKNLSKAAEEGRLDPIVGRENIIDRVAQILSRRKKNNPILVGEAGVGKSAIAEGLAINIAKKKVPYTLLNKRIFTLDLASVVAGTKYRGQFEERLKGLISDLQKNPDIILFIDEIHTMIGAGNAEGGLDASNIFKPALARGEIQCIGATTNDEYRKHFETDAALERRFQKVLVEPTTVEETITILNNIKPYYERYHKVKYTDKAIEACVKLSERYMSERFLPDKAIDVMDEAGARCHVRNVHITEEMSNISLKIEKAEKEKEQCVKEQKYERANTLKNDIADLQKAYSIQKDNWEKDMEKHPLKINEKFIAEVLSSMTGIEIKQVDKDEREKLLNMENNLEKKVVGQNDAVNKICKAVRRARLGLKDPNRPIGSFIFVGQTGVGKTYLAKCLAEYLFDSRDSIIRLDMSEYMEKFNVSRLVGSAPGYIGYEEGGQLTEQVRLHPYSIVLFDEIEKAHRDVFNILLQILDEGRLTDSMGRTVDFRNTIVIMTSNIGSRTLQDFGTGVGFSTINRQNNSTELEQNVIDKDIRKTFAPEFLNRIDDVVFFHPLTNDNLLNIVSLEIKILSQRLEDMGYKLSVSKSAKQHILDMDTNHAFGARPIKRAIQKEIEDKLSEILLKNMHSRKRHIFISETSGKEKQLKFEIK